MLRAMGLWSAIGRAAPFLAAGAAAGWYLRRQGYLGGAGPGALPAAAPAEAPPLEQHLDAVEAVSDAADVTSVIEDLLAAAPSELDEHEDA